MTEATKPVVRKIRPRHVPHGVKPLLCVTLFADGTLLLKEHGRRSGAELFDLVNLYVARKLRKAGV